MAYEPRTTARPGYEPRDAKYNDPMRVGRRQTPAEIEAEIEATRRRIEDRLNVIQGETAPSRLLEKGLGTDLSSPIDTASALLERAKHNPLGAGLIAAGLAALYFNRNERPVERTDPAYRAEVPGPATTDAAERVAYDIAALKGQANAIADDTRAAKDRLTSQVSSTAGAFRSDAERTSRDVSEAYADAKLSAMTKAEKAKFKAMSAAEQAKLKAKWAYESASDTVSDWADDARDAFERAPTVMRERADYAGRWVQENPVTAGLIGLALGAAAASVFAAKRSNAPRSRAAATRDLYRSSNGYETSEYLQEQAMRRKAGAGTAVSATRSGSTGTQASAPKSAANPARSTANQMARRAPATAKETTGKSVSTEASSTVKKASTKSKGSSAKTRSSANKGATRAASSKSSATKSSAAKPATSKAKASPAKATPKVKAASMSPSPSTNGTAKTYSAAAPASTRSPSTSGRPASSDAPKPN